jgi:NTP pyrophosphatase (non-canonical NTP hydrolase)
MTARDEVKHWIAAWNMVGQLARAHTVAAGFTADALPDNREDAIRLVLIHSEVSEALEVVRTGDGPSEHIPGFSALEEELADVVIRVADLGEARKLQVGAAILAKLCFNQTRPPRHGGKAF